MKKLLSAAFIFSLLLITTNSVSAQDSTRSALLKNHFAEKTENINDKIASRDAKLKEKLAKFKDQRKATTVLRINTNLANINKLRTDLMKKHLEILTNITDKLASNSSSSAINDARSKISSASAAVDLQAQKDYTIEATSESTIQKDAQAKREALHNDLKIVQQLIMIARQAVFNAI